MYIKLYLLETRHNPAAIIALLHSSLFTKWNSGERLCFGHYSPHTNKVASVVHLYTQVVIAHVMQLIVNTQL